MNGGRDRLSDEAIARFLQARSSDADAGLLDDIVRTVGVTRQDRPWLGLTPQLLPTRTILIAAIALLLAAMGAIGVGSQLLQPDPVRAERFERVPAAQVAVIRDHVDALNLSDAAAFTETFAPDGVFQPGGDFRASSSLFGNSLPVADASLVEAWMAINDAWGFEAEVVSCTGDAAAPIVYGYGEGRGEPMVVTCEVATRWHALSTEITQTWAYELHGSDIGHWGYSLLDLDPRERALPLGYDGLMAWERWLAETDPETAARLLNPRGGQQPGTCDGCQEWWDSLAPGDPERTAELAPLLVGAENDWSIQGRDFAPYGLVPYDPALAEEISASIREYLDAR